MEVSIINHRLPFISIQTYPVRFFRVSICTTVTRNPLTVENWIFETEYLCRSHLSHLHHLVIGLDIEWRPMFACRRIAATIHICIGNRCIIFQFLYPWFIPKSLVQFFNNPNHTFVGVGIKNDLEQMEKDFEYGIVPPSVVDLSELAARHFGDGKLRNAGLEALAKRVLKLEVVRPREIFFSRWDNMCLTDQQVQYACIEAFVSFEIGRVLCA